MKISKILHFLKRGLRQPHKNNILLVGDIVEVRSESEILATLDENGKFEGLKFMPEMIKYCGRKFKIGKRINRIIIEKSGIGMRNMQNTVILSGVVCDGQAHDGCQRTCLLFWKDKWLKRV